jgi:hypothetical protein
MIRYTLLKALQTSVFIILPIIIYNHVIQGGIFDVVMIIIDMFILSMYVDDLRTRSLEKKLHGELY